MLQGATGSHTLTRIYSIQVSIKAVAVINSFVHILNDYAFQLI